MGNITLGEVEAIKKAFSLEGAHEWADRVLDEMEGEPFRSRDCTRRIIAFALLSHLGSLTPKEDHAPPLKWREHHTDGLNSRWEAITGETTYGVCVTVRRNAVAYEATSEGPRWHGGYHGTPEAAKEACQVHRDATQADAALDKKTQ